MKIYIIDESKQKIEMAKHYFKNTDIVLVNEKFSNFMKNNDVECIVSPANSFGLMDGGYDYAITDWFGDELQDRVQNYIIKNYYGEQPVGTSFIIDANDKGQKLIHTPTMQTPRRILDPFVIYQCMRSTLMCAYQNKVNSILIPLFGGGCGCVETKTIAKMMRYAYNQIQNPPKNLDWSYAHDIEIMY